MLGASWEIGKIGRMGRMGRKRCSELVWVWESKRPWCGDEVAILCERVWWLELAWLGNGGEGRRG